MLYIQLRSNNMTRPWGIVHEETRWRKWGLGWVTMPTTWGADWDYSGTADCHRHTLDPCPRWFQEASIVTLRDVWTCKTTLALAYMLYHLSAVWLQFPMKERSPK